MVYNFFSHTHAESTKSLCKSSCNPLGGSVPQPCSRLIPRHFFGIDYLTFFFFCIMFYLSPAEWLCAVIEGFASEFKSVSAGVESRVVKRLLHFCSPLITLTFDHVLCSCSWSYESTHDAFSFKQIHIFVPARLWVNCGAQVFVAASAWLMSISYHRSAYFCYANLFKMAAASDKLSHSSYVLRWESEVNSKQDAFLHFSVCHSQVWNCRFQ